jgi:hypothetical protein
MSSLHPALLTWPFALLVGVPLVIHLINLLRRRRVQWAAMEFLLASQKKNRRKIILQQWALIAARMASIGVALLLLAGLVLSGDWARLFGQGEAHHLLIIDDTPSMSAQGPAGSAFDRAKEATRRLARQIAQENAPQRVTLLPYTIVADGSWNAEEDWVARPVESTELSAKVETQLRDWQPTQIATAPLAVLDGVDRLLAQGRAGEERTLHIITDFRTGDWQNVAPIRERLERLAAAGVKLHFVNCTLAAGKNVEPNIAVSGLRLLPGARAAGVPQLIEVAVANLGGITVEGVSVETSYRPMANAAKPATPTDSNAVAISTFPASDAPWSSLPAIEFDPIKPGETQTARLQVRFPAAADYAMRAVLAGPALATSDSLPVDNTRYGIAKIALDVPVLVIDGDPRDDDAFHVTTALRPGGATRTGVNVTVKPAAFLRDQALDEFAVIYLLDVGRLEQTAINALESFACSGGGVAFFTGENAHRTTINESLFRGGEGIFPIAVEGPADLPYALPDSSSSDAAIAAPPTDIAFDRSGPLARLAGEAYQGFAPHVTRYLSVDASSLAKKDSPVAVAARLRNNAPLVVVRPFGEGRVVAVLTTAGRAWSDWAGTLTFPILLQEMQGYLTAGQTTEQEAATGTPIDVQLNANRHPAGATVSLRTPYDVTSPFAKFERRAEPDAAGPLVAHFGNRDRRETGRIGIYEATCVDKDGMPSVRRDVRNTASEESNLAALDARALADELKGIDHVYHGYAEIEDQTTRVAGMDASPYLFWLLIALLAGEQLLGYWSSYHPSRAEVA